MPHFIITLKMTWCRKCLVFIFQYFSSSLLNLSKLYGQLIAFLDEFLPKNNKILIFLFTFLSQHLNFLTNIKSFAMSMSKYNFTWNRIGLRWSRQRTMDSCSLISAQKKYNELTTACGSFMMDNIPRDYGWEKYGDTVEKICKKLDLTPTMFFYVVKDKDNKLYSIGNILGKIKQ